MFADGVKRTDTQSSRSHRLAEGDGSASRRSSPRCCVAARGALGDWPANRTGCISDRATHRRRSLPPVATRLSSLFVDGSRRDWRARYASTRHRRGLPARCPRFGRGSLARRRDISHVNGDDQETLIAGTRSKTNRQRVALPIDHPTLYPPPSTLHPPFLRPILKLGIELRVLRVEGDRAAVDEEILRVRLRLENVAGRHDDVPHLADVE
jgi:hypothetical protein